MRPRPAPVIVLLSLAIAAPSEALPPGETRLREGANHRVGDDSFVARFGRAPGPADAEALRMRTHLEHARARLLAAPPTRPELAGRRAELLGYLGEYIAKGITPVNTRLPWRSPVFIDDFGNICAVGYLIERSAGRALPERIARLHRFDYLEDIAAAMPEVRAWAESSGLSLDELASIQPGYEAPMVEQWSRWDLGGEVRPKDGPYTRAEEVSGIRTTGTFRRGAMEGAWAQLDRQGHVIGKGTFARGAGTWHSSYADGKRLAEGPFAASLPHGSWTFYHPSGRIAAQGAFSRGERDGSWTFYYDAPGKIAIAAGAFTRGSITGRWEHFDERGRRVAVSSDATPPAWEYTSGGHLLEVSPYADGVRHAVHAGNIAGDDWRLDAFSLGDEHLYEIYRSDRLYDAEGHAFSKESGAWTAADCRWSEKRKRIARAGDITTLHGLIYRDHVRARDGGAVEDCGDPRPVPAARAARIEKLLAVRRAVRTPNPAFVKQAALGGWLQSNGPEEADSGEQAAALAAATAPAPSQTPAEAEQQARWDAEADDLTKTLAHHMGWYIEFPHIDGRFIQVFYTLPGFTPGLRSAEFAEPDPR